MAYRLLHEGRSADERYRKDKGHIPVLARKLGSEVIVVTRQEVKQYLTDPEFLSAMEMYHYVKMWGLPNGGGWANEPCEVLEAITAIELEVKAIEKEAIDGRTADRNPPSGGRGR